ncbi:Putative glucose-6-phosphate 1-epimerase [Actinomyces bovis]|uniref:Putative glucose-6-phosphate 1-epimerase n=1 Tax=Actinomyces bovis TaxID=1658 RepID=A0ABY1VKY6_9ACTO|nr:D-hexose-6-phosphate mutarotase [Actinomyces bovis]SPT52417.1 Putative glucose-6-phosphate 1-epimerase [Actinomyces bovis]VEG54042.1 Putative glucose-6-phosphate 1-epimerase [Actinomyces israelii]
MTTSNGSAASPSHANSSRAVLPRTAALGPGQGGEPRLLVDASAGSAELYLFGAHLTSWVPRGGKPVLFLSRKAVFDGETGIRGGVPLCLPWFGVGPDGSARPKHGWARTLTWDLRTVQSTPDGGVRALLTLEHDSISAMYEVGIGAQLSMSLSLRNTGTQPRLVEAALHSYLAVHDVTACVVTGVEGAEYTEDGVSGQVQDGPLRVSGPVDRVYRSGETVRVTDPGNYRRIVVEGLNSPTTVVWNPWSTFSKGMADLADDEFPRFLCVETAAARQDAPVIEPGQSWSMAARIYTEAL